jgi:hypothetical protein
VPREHGTDRAQRRNCLGVPKLRDAAALAPVQNEWGIETQLESFRRASGLEVQWFAYSETTGR